MKIENQLEEKYNDYYKDEISEWSTIGAIGKVENIIEVSRYKKFENIIEVGAGDGSILAFLNEKKFCKKATAAEISDSGIEQIKKKNIEIVKWVIKFDGYELPLKDKEFDLAICTHVVEHVEHPRKLLREIKRVSEYQVFEIPIDFSFNVDKKVEHFLSYGHINIYTPSLFKFLLKSEGFEIVNEKYSLYDMKVLNYQMKKKNVKYFILLFKRFLLKLIPFLMKIKPNTYTVLTKDSGKNLEINSKEI